MKIRTSNKPVDEQALENSFVAVDDLETPMGTLSVAPLRNDELMPERPFEVKLTVHGKAAAADALLGAGLSRGMYLAQQEGVPARIYAQCLPSETQKLELLLGLGFENDDALVRMRRKVVGGLSIARLGEGMAFVEDRLDDETERAFFLEREEKLFRKEKPEEWLEKLEKMNGFRRLLAVGRDGLAGELLLYETGTVGVVAQVYTAPARRRQHVAMFLLERARQYFYQDRMQEAIADVRLRQTGAVALFASAGYRQSEVVCRYPGVDLQAEPGRTSCRSAGPTATSCRGFW